ncbi:hypothetical protein Tco_0025209 [Tanacetum coccineum]
MIQVKEMMQDKDLKNSKSKDKGSRSGLRGMNEQSHYKQDTTKRRRSSNVISSMLGRSKKTSTLGEIVSHSGDSITSIKRRRRDLSSDDIKETTTSGHNRLKSELEDSTW